MTKLEAIAQRAPVQPSIPRPGGVVAGHGGSWLAHAGVALVLALATLVAHGWALGDGLFLDDHWHQQQLRARGWSMTDLLEAATIEPARFMNAWWQDKPVVWKYPRPFSFLVMKVVHEFSGGSVVAHHAVSLLMHFVNACLVYFLCLKLTASRFWSLWGGLLFVVYSHSVFAVGWLAAQNAVLQTMLMLASLLCYVRASGLRLGPTAPTPTYHDGSDSPRLGRVPFAWALALWCLALLTRENALMMPVIAVAMDLAFAGRWRLRERRWAYAAFAAIAATFLLWRFVYWYHPIPEVYARRPDGAAYIPWCLAKLMHYLCSAIWLSPMVIGPTGRLNPFTEVPGDCLLMAVILAVLGAGYYVSCRKARGYWIWPLWLVLSVLPVVPIMATPHSGYLCGVGFSVAMILGPGLRPRLKPTGRRWSRVVAVWFLMATCTYVPIYRTLWSGMIAAEKCAMGRVTAEPRPEGVTDIFFINLPFVNVYARLCLEEVWGPIAADELRTHALTFSPDLIRMDSDCVVEQIDDRSFSLATAGRPYFGGLLGRFLLDGMRWEGRPREGEVVGQDLYDVRIAETDEEGLRKLIFTFHRPLCDPKYRFYLTTPGCPAARLAFRPVIGQPSQKPLADALRSPEDVRLSAAALASGRASAAEPLFATLGADDDSLGQQAWAAFAAIADTVARELGAPVQDGLSDGQPSEQDLARVQDWWRNSVDDATLTELWVNRDVDLELRATRDAIFTVRGNAAWVVQTDLYLTGPPFLGPK